MCFGGMKFRPSSSRSGILPSRICGVADLEKPYGWHYAIRTNKMTTQYRLECIVMESDVGLRLH